MPLPLGVSNARQHRDWCWSLCVCLRSLCHDEHCSTGTCAGLCLSVFSLFVPLSHSEYCWSVGLSVFSLSAPLCHGEHCSAAPLCHGECCLTGTCARVCLFSVCVPLSVMVSTAQQGLVPVCVFCLHFKCHCPSLPW